MTGMTQMFLCKARRGSAPQMSVRLHDNRLRDEHVNYPEIVT
jgi:hypothetical protein